MKNLAWFTRHALERRLRQTLLSLPPFPTTPEMSEPWQAWLRNAWAAVMEPYAPVGAAIAFAYRHQPLGIYVQGEAIRGVSPVREDTAFRVASLSKAFGTLAIARLIDMGRLDLDADISDCLGFAFRHPLYPRVPITARQLMTHTAGLVDTGDYDRTAGTPAMDPLAQLSRQQANFTRRAPGHAFHYSNLGAGVLGALVEAITDRDLDAYCQEALFGPLGMDASFHPQRIADPGRLASIYRLPGNALTYDSGSIAAQPLRPGPDPALHYATLPGKLMISAPDALRLLLHLLGGETPAPPCLASPATLQEMRTLQNRRGSVTGKAGRGLNVAIAPDIYAQGRILFGHQGMAYGAVCSAWGDPLDGSAIVLLTNGADERRCGPVACFVQDVTAVYYAAVSQWSRASKKNGLSRN